MVWIAFRMAVSRECSGYWGSIYGRCGGCELVKRMRMINIVDGGVQFDN